MMRTKKYSFTSFLLHIFLISFKYAIDRTKKYRITKSN